MTAKEKIITAIMGSLAGLAIALGYMAIVDHALAERDAETGINSKAIIQEVK